MDRKKLLKSKRNGSAIALVLVAVVILLVIGAGLLNLGLHGRSLAARTSVEIAARSAADAGLTKAVFEMNEKLKFIPWDGNTMPHATNEALPNCNATFSYTVTGDLGNGYNVESIGSSSQAARSVKANLRLKGVFDYGILSKGTIKLYSGTVVDGYDSENPGETDVPVQIATASTDEGSITLMGNANVDGGTLLGVDACFPKVNPPELVEMGMIDIQNTTLTLGPADSGEYTDISIKTDGTLIIDAGVDGGEVVLYVPGDMWLGQGCELVIRPNTSLAIYLDGDLTAGNSAGINNETQDSTNFVLYGTGEDQTFDLKAKSSWYGAIYAPEADISIKAGSDIYGSFIGSSFENKAGGFIFYDAALRNVETTDIGVTFVVERWQE